jgi:hypothetical protein
MERRQTGGLTINQFEEFAAKAAEAGYSYSAGNLGVNEIKQILGTMGEEIEDVSKLAENIDLLGRDFDNLSVGALAQQ